MKKLGNHLLKEKNAEKKLPDKIGLPLRVVSIPLIVIGLIMQFTFFNP